MGEYVLNFFVAIGMVTAMTIYFKRAIQARMFDARNTMFNMIANRVQNYYSGNTIFFQYEPYYGNTVSTVARQENAATNLLPSPGLSSGIFRKTIDETTSIQTQSETAPPRDAN